MRFSRAVLLACASLLVFSGISDAQTAKAPENPPPQPVARFDVNDCKTCHEQALTSFEHTRHMKLPASCESCHGDVTNHLQSEMDKGEVGTIISFKKMAPEGVNKACLTCHDQGRQANWTGGVHDRRDLSCTTCHSVHEFKSLQNQLKTTRDSETCFSCHGDLARSMTQRSRHPLREGKMRCASCHDPHGSAGEKLVRAKTTNELCYSCHAEKRGPFLWEHSPVRENCLSCHAPHGSNQENLLVVQAARLCQQCHMQGRHQTVAGMPNEPWNFNRSCLNCHPRIHGSNHPSGVIFQR